MLGYHDVQLRTSKDIALNRRTAPCYEGQDYTLQEYKKLQQIIEETLLLVSIISFLYFS